MPTDTELKPECDLVGMREMTNVAQVRRMVASVLARFEAGGDVRKCERARVLISGGIALAQIMKDLELQDLKNEFEKLKEQVAQLSQRRAA